MKRLIRGCCCILIASIFCQCSSERPPAAGTIRAVDPLAQKYMAEAKKMEEQNRLKKAIGKYDDIVEDCPLSVEAPYALLRMGQLREQLNDPQDAFDHYQWLIERYPDSSYYKQALQRQKEMAFAAATGKLTNKVLWLYKVNMDSSVVIKWLNSVCDNAPFSSSAPEAKKVLGDYLLQRDRKDEAIEAYQSIVDNYPHSPFAPEAQLKVAEVYAQSRMTGDLSFSNILKAQEAYEEFILRYPGHSQISRARTGLAGVRQYMVQRKLEVGEYYMFRMKDRDAAMFSFQEVIAGEKANPEAAAKAREYLKQLNVSVS